MFYLNTGKYMYTASPKYFYSICSLRKIRRSSDSDDGIRSYDHMLHQLLDKIFRERCLSSSGQIKEFLRGPQLKSMIKPILDQETILSEHFSKEEMGKLSLLWISVLCCYEKSAELLVRSGADVNELFGCHDFKFIDEKWTILHVLVQMDSSPENERLIRLAIDQGADLRARDYKRQTVLHIAVREVRVKVVEMLLEKGADINCSDKDGKTPLLIAASDEKATELLPLLMKHGADVFAKSRSRKNVLHHLARLESHELSPVEHVELARGFIEKGVSIDDKEIYDHRQPIHEAAVNGKSELINLFLDYGADVNALTKSGKSPLYMAAEYNNNTEAESLLKRGANVDLRTLEGRTALHAVCEGAAEFFDNEDGESEKIIRLLVSAGADVFAEDSDGKTPLTLISSSENEELPEQVFWPLIEALALKKALQPSIELKDERIIERYPKLRDYCQKCIDEIDRMKSTRFIETCTFFELFAKSQCQIAALMQNHEFESKFRLYDLNGGFPIYARDIVRAFERSQDHFRSLLKQADVINEAVYDILPYLVVKKVVLHIFDCSENLK